MSAYKRVQQWATFARIWHVYDAKWQDPFPSAKHLRKYLTGEWKPIYHPVNHCGDHVVVINTKHIALRGDEWRKRVYFHHTTYPGGATWTPAWQLHDKDPTMILWKAIYSILDKNLTRRYTMQRLHLFPEDKIPDDIAANITSQIRQLRPIPVKFNEYTEEEKKQFPQIFDLPEDFPTTSVAPPKEKQFVKKKKDQQ